MPEVGVRELKTRASEIIRELRENRIRYTITYRGKPVGILIPLDRAEPIEQSFASDDAVWKELTRLSEEIGRGWKSPLTGVEILSQMRDEEAIYGVETLNG